MNKESNEQFNRIIKTVLEKNDLFVKQKYLYHYTDIYGLEGIINNHKLWLSERNYMNDVNDENFIQNYLKHYFNDSKKWEDSILQSEMLPQKNQYIFSTSTEEDLIHQWTYYGSQQSFCIELNREALIDLFYESNNEIDFYYGPVFYVEEDFNNSVNDKIKRIINDVIKEYKGVILERLDNLSKVKTSAEKEEQYRQVFQYFYSAIKQYGHYCEHEYRFTLQSDTKPEFRVRKGLFVPYLEIPFEPEKIISKIIIGPNNKEDYLKQNLKYFLNEKGLAGIEVSTSRMRIR